MYLDMSQIFPLAGLAATAGGFYLTIAGSLMAILARDLTVNVAHLSILGSLYGIALLVQGPLAKFTLRYGPVWLFRLGPIAAIEGIALMVWCPNVPTVIAGAALAALGTSTSSIANPSIFYGVQGVSRLAVINGLASGMSILSTILFAVFEFLYSGSGRFALIALGLPLIVQVIHAWRTPAVPFSVFIARQTDEFLMAKIRQISLNNQTLPSPSKRTSTGSVIPERTSVNVASSQASTKMKTIQIVRILVNAGVEFAFYAWSVERLMDVGVSLAQASALATAFALGMTLGRITGSRFVYRRNAVYVYITLGLVGALITGFVPVPFLVACGIFIAGLGTSCLFPIGASYYSGLPGIEPATAAATINIVCGLGALITPILLGAVLVATGLQVAFGLLAGMYALLLILPRPENRR